MSICSVCLTADEVLSAMLALNDIVEVLHLYKVDRKVIDEIMPNISSIKHKITSGKHFGNENTAIRKKVN